MAEKFTDLLQYVRIKVFPLLDRGCGNFSISRKKEKCSMPLEKGAERNDRLHKTTE